MEEGVDAAIRVGHDEDSRLVGRVLTTAETIVVATPAAVTAQEEPQSPIDLAAMPCILFGEHSDHAGWTLWRGERCVPVPVTGRLRRPSPKPCLDAAAAGAGFADVPAFIARSILESGELSRLRAFIGEAADAFGAVSL